MKPVIECTGLVVSYGRKRALDGLDLQVAPGEIFGFIGPNGAGKSTAIKTILGLIPPQKGSVRLHGLSPDRPASRRHVGYLSEEPSFHRYLTPAEILAFFGTLHGVPRRMLQNRIRETLRLVGLEDARNRRIAELSKGMAQKVNLALALVSDPETLILDEPTSGLDPLARLALRDILLDQKRRGKTVFFSSHELSEVELICDSLAVIRGGRVLRTGPLKEILSEAPDKSLERLFLAMMKEGGA